MRSNTIKATIKTAILAVTILLLGTSALAQQVNLTAAQANLTLPDGSVVPMWGYSCGAAANNSSVTCAALNQMAGTGWSPVVITVPTGQDLTINLTNNLSFGSNSVPTSLMILGQLGAGLGTTATTTPSPKHDNMGTTWPIGDGGAVNTPPSQGPRVQSFSTEVAAGATTALTWRSPRPGTYLIESGTHPSIQGPMGLYGILVVTSAPSGTAAGTAYPGVSYAADLPLLLSEIDPIQNNAVTTAVNTSGFSESATRGPYLAGPVTSIDLKNGGSGYTSAPTITFSGGGGTTSATATATVDTDSTSPTYGQVTAIDITGGGTYISAPIVNLSGGGGSGALATAALQLNANGIAHCSGGASACYPPVVNYTPLYYLFNGVGFNKTSAVTSLFSVWPSTGVSGNVLVRLVNAGLRMHVPSIVGSSTGASAVPGFSLIAEDGNPLPGLPRVQNEVFLAAGKTYDVMINVPAAGGTALPVFDRELSLSGNATERDAGMLAYISINGATLPSAGAFANAIANADTYNYLVPGNTLTVSDPAKGVIANDINVYGVQVSTPPTQGSLTLNANGTFTYIPNSGTTSDSFTYCANGTATACAGVTLGAAAIEASTGIVMNPITYTSRIATSLSIKSPGILSVDKDAAGYPLSVATSSVILASGQSSWTLSVDKSGGFNASVPAPGTYTFTYQAKNSQGTLSASTATVTLIFPQPSNLAVTVVDGNDKTTAIVDYRWIIEEDRTFNMDPAKTTNSGEIVPTFGTNFHTSYMPVVATGCTGDLSCESGQSVLGNPAVCDMGNGACRTDADQQTAVDPSQVVLDPTKRYYISVLPGDAATPFNTANAQSGHGMGGAPIAAGQKAVKVLAQPTPFPPAKLSVFVFEDDFPLNGEQDAGGGVDVLAPNEPGLGQFNITLFDDAGGPGDATGQMTYDMFNQPLSNSLAGTIDPATGNDACPISQQSSSDPNQRGITGTIITCPKYESGGKVLSPLAGQAIVANMMPGRYGVVATPGADRSARGEEWLQTNTLDGQKAHDSFLRVGEAGYFQEYGPAGYHVSIGFANPAIINSRKAGVCNGSDINITGSNCANTVKGVVTTERMSRTPDERLYSSGDNSSFAFTQCYVSFGDPDGEDFAFTKCNSDGSFSLSGLPDGSWRVTVFDQWNDMLVDGLSTPVALNGGTTDLGQIAINQWQSNIYTKTFFDLNGDGVAQDKEPGLSLVPTNIRFRDGSFSNFNNTDLSGNAGFNEVFPLFNWYVVETDTTRYKNTGTHVVYDAGGPADGSTCSDPTAPCGNSNIAQNLANTAERVSVPANLRVPGAVYCANADCTDIPDGIKAGPSGSATGTLSTGRIDPPWVLTEGWQGFSGQNSFLEFGKAAYASGENGGIKGHVVYASTRPFDDPTLLLQLSWEPLVPHVTINLYEEGTAPDGSQSLKLADTTQTTSFDDWAQGFRSDGVPNMNCPGQTTADLFYFSLYNQPNWLDVYNNGGTASQSLPNNSQFKCYDGMHNWNQLEPAPYDGMYQFPSVTSMNPQTGKPTGTNCTICVPNPDNNDPYRAGLPMLPKGKYVVEVVVPAGYELVKEEDKNILIGDNYIAPVTQEFGGLGNIFILPDQAEINAAYNSNNGQNPTQGLGRTTLPSHEGDTGTIETYWPCIGQARIVPDYISLFPKSNEVAPFAGATRNLCDRKEVTLDDQTSALAKFYLFTSTHAAAHFTGVITDDFTSEFDPFSPQFGEKFAPPNLPISIKDWTGSEVSRVYSDQWGAYNGLTYSTWEVNPPNPTGYAPQMMVTCMNDPGSGAIPDALFNPGYSQFCYEIPFMPGQTQYMDTPVTPTTAFSEGYNHPDCAYPDATPAIKEVDGDGIGPWVGAAQGSVASLTLGAPGSGYTSIPTVTLTGGGGSGAKAAVADLKVVSILLTNGGSGYSSAPTITISGGNGSGATARATITNGKVTSVTLTSLGSGYTSRPTVTFSAPGGRNTNRAMGTALLGVNSLSLTASGSGYTSAPNVSFSSGGATATAALGSSTQRLVITALGDQTETNNAYSGPSATTAPFNQKTITRHYGFGSTPGTVKIGGVAAPLAAEGWNDSQITVTVPSGVPACNLQQQAQYGGSTAQCGELVITAANGKQSIDAVTVTIGGKTPTHVTSSIPLSQSGSGSIQSAIDAAAPGDLIIVNPGVYNEMLLVWKPVRLQGVGAASSVINANTHPAGKLDPWRRQVNCLFGLALNGQPSSANTTTNNPNPGSNPYDPTGAFSCGGWSGFTGGPNNPQVDRLPLEGILGWDTTVNGNLAQLLQEPTLMGAYEGAGITVLAKGVRMPAGATNIFGSGSESAFPTGTVLLTNSSKDCNDFPSNFQCNPSSIDGMSITNSSQGGGGIFVHAWGHNLQIANNRVYNNSGTLTGGITIGQGESPDAYLAGDASNADPGSCQISSIPNDQLPYCFDTHVNVHHNAVMLNSSIGDELYSSTPAGGGGVTFCTGADYYQFNYNWVCGNLSTGDGGGLVHLGFIYNGDIERNSILFNQSTNPTVPTNGGGLIVMGAPPDGLTASGLECGNTAADADCTPGLSDGTGPNLTINANLIMGNAAESGSGGGLRFQGVNGTDVVNFPRNSGQWNSVTVTNNIIANNVAGWDGAGISLQDALKVNIVNNTIMSNDTTASSGVLFNTLGAPIASGQGPTCTANCGTTSAPQPAGLVTMQHSAVLASTLPNTVVCPLGHPNCANISNPLLYNDVFWQNRSFYIGVGSLGSGGLSQQNVVALYNAFTTTRAASEPIADASAPNGNGLVITGGTGGCVPGASYWDIGVRGDTGPSTHSSGATLSPVYSVLTDASDYSGNSNLGSNPTVNSQYCNGSRTPPEYASMGYQVPPGISDATVPNPVFNLTPSATVDEGNNWINLSWGPLAMTNPITHSNLGDYSLAPVSPAINYIPLLSVAAGLAPNTDYFGNPRPAAPGTPIDVGAVEFQGSTPPPTLSSIAPNTGTQGAVVPVTLSGTNLTGATAVTVSGTGVTVSGPTVVNSTTVTITFTISASANRTARNVTINTPGGTSNGVTFTVTAPPLPTLTSISPNIGTRGSTVSVTLTGTNLTGATSVNVTRPGGGTVGVTVTGFAVVNSTTVTATFTIAGTANVSGRNVSVITPNGTSNTVAFTVTAPPPPTLSSVNPGTGSRGTSSTFTLSGTNLTGATAVTLSGTRVSTSNVVVVNSTTVAATFTIQGNAATGNRTVSVTTPNGTSNTVNFTVQ